MLWVQPHYCKTARIIISVNSSNFVASSLEASCQLRASLTNACKDNCGIQKVTTGALIMQFISYTSRSSDHFVNGNRFAMCKLLWLRADRTQYVRKRHRSHICLPWRSCCRDDIIITAVVALSNITVSGGGGITLSSLFELVWSGFRQLEQGCLTDGV